jgi:hypothetical protein
MNIEKSEGLLKTTFVNRLKRVWNSRAASAARNQTSHETIRFVRMCVPYLRHTRKECLGEDLLLVRSLY